MNTLKIIASFLILFSLYHAAEYMIMFRNSISGFFGFQFLFFLAAWILGNWYSGMGLNAWGLPFKNAALKNILPGILTGLLMYGLAFFVNIGFGVEKVVSAPPFLLFLKASLPFVFGVVFSSFSEDILTRGLVYTHLNEKVGSALLVLISALIYLLNHIYRLTEGPEAGCYIFLLGVNFMIPLVLTKNLWFTGSMHWAGNAFFFMTHQVMKTETPAGVISPNYVFAICLLAFIPLNWFISSRFKPAG